MNESEVRAVTQTEVLKAFKKLREATDWYTFGYDDETHDTAYVIQGTVDRAIQELTPESCQHIYKSCEDAQGNGGASCILCYEREPKPVNPFAPEHTAQQWADQIGELLQQAQNDGHAVWFTGNSEVGHSLRIGNGSDAPEVWGSDE